MTKFLPRILLATFALGFLVGCEELDDNNHRHHRHRHDDDNGYNHGPPPPPENRDDDYDGPRRHHHDDDYDGDYPRENGDRPRPYRDNGGY